jgi:hypothetical protein
MRVYRPAVDCLNLSKAGWSWGCVSGVDSRGQTIFVADAHRGDRRRFIVRADERLSALGLCGHIGKGVLVSGLKMRRNFLHRQLTGRSVAAENIHVVVDVADRANRRVIPASAFAAFGPNSFTPFFMRKLLHNGNDALKGCTVASPPLLLSNRWKKHF